MVAAVVGEPVRSKVAPVARRVAAVQVVVVVVACRPAFERPPHPRIPRSGTAAASLRYLRGMLVRNTFAAPVAVACTPAHSIPAAEAAAVPAAEAHIAPLAHEPLVARTAAAARAPPPHSGVPAAGTPRTDPAAVQAAAG